MKLKYIEKMEKRFLAKLKKRDIKIWNFLNDKKIDAKIFLLKWVLTLFSTTMEFDYFYKVLDFLVLNSFE